MKRSEGFTLIEVLIVVVIIAILASLILPRMTAMTKRAEAAEAMQTLGVLKRAGERYFDMLGDQNFSLEMGVDNSNCVGTSNDHLWASLGVKKPESSQWGYYVYLYRNPGDLYLSVFAIHQAESGCEIYAGMGTQNNVPWYDCNGMSEMKDSQGNVIGCTF